MAVAKKRTYIPTLGSQPLKGGLSSHKDRAVPGSSKLHTLVALVLHWNRDGDATGTGPMIRNFENKKQ